MAVVDRVIEFFTLRNLLNLYHHAFELCRFRGHGRYVFDMENSFIRNTSVGFFSLQCNLANDIFCAMQTHKTYDGYFTLEVWNLRNSVLLKRHPKKRVRKMFIVFWWQRESQWLLLCEFCAPQWSWSINFLKKLYQKFIEKKFTTQVGSPAVRLRSAGCTAWVKRWSEAMDFLQTIFETNISLSGIFENYIIKG